METDKTEGAVDTTNNEGTENDTISISKKDYETMNQTLGSMKRELKDFKKSKEESTSSKKDSTDDNVLLNRIEKVSLRQAGITHADDIELARNTAKKWGMDIEDVLLDDDFKLKLERTQSNRSNVEATSNIKGGAGKSQAKDTPEYWIAKGVPPSVDDVPNRKLRVTIAKAMMANTKSGKKFYND